MLNRIGDVARKLDEPEHVIRYWCQVFGIRVTRRPSGHRVFSEHTEAQVTEVHRLLRTEGYTIAGAKKKLGAQ